MSGNGDGPVSLVSIRVEYSQVDEGAEITSWWLLGIYISLVLTLRLGAYWDLAQQPRLALFYQCEAKL
jgi:hypothetical protein